jgi:hypothetical protein
MHAFQGDTHYIWVGNTLVRLERKKHSSSTGSFDKEMVEVM